METACSACRNPVSGRHLYIYTTLHPNHFQALYKVLKQPHQTACNVSTIARRQFIASNPLPVTQRYDSSQLLFWARSSSQRQWRHMLGLALGPE